MNEQRLTELLYASELLANYYAVYVDLLDRKDTRRKSFESSEDLDTAIVEIKKTIDDTEKDLVYFVKREYI